MLWLTEVCMDHIYKGRKYEKEKSFYSGNTLPYLMKKEVSIDIDDKSDLLLAELILKNRIENEKNI